MNKAWNDKVLTETVGLPNGVVPIVVVIVPSSRAAGTRGGIAAGDIVLHLPVVASVLAVWE